MEFSTCSSWNPSRRSRPFASRYSSRAEMGGGVASTVTPMINGDVQPSVCCNVTSRGGLPGSTNHTRISESGARCPMTYCWGKSESPRRIRRITRPARLMVQSLLEIHNIARRGECLADRANRGRHFNVEEYRHWDCLADTEPPCVSMRTDRLIVCPHAHAWRFGAYTVRPDNSALSKPSGIPTSVSHTR